MAVLETIRVKYGVLITVLIGVALLGFIVSFDVVLQALDSSSSKNDVGVIGSKSISYEDFQKELERHSLISEISTGSSTKTNEQQKEINNVAWKSLIDKNLFIKNANNAGIYVSDEEMKAIRSGEIVSDVFSRNPMFYDENGMFSVERLNDFIDYVSSDESGRLQIFWEYLQNEAKTQMYYTKYNALMNHSNFTNPLMVTNKLADNNNTFDVEFVMVPFGFAKDTTIVVSEKEIKNYYNDHKKFYKQKASRDIEYVVFEINPSVEDITATNDAIAAVYDDFASTDINNIKSFVSLNSDRSYDSHWYKEGELNTVSRKVNDFVFKSSGKVSSPIIQDGDTFYAVRVLDIKRVPEEVNVKFVPEGTENLDAALAAAESQWIPQTPGFEDLMTVEVGKTETINGMVFKVIGTRNPSLKKRVAILEKKSSASEKTRSEVYELANRFATKANGGYENFTKAVDEEGVYAHPVNKMLESAERLGSIDNTKEITRWAFKADKNDVSENLFDIDNKYFVVAVVKDTHEEGYTPVAEVSETIKDIIYSEKLGQKKAAEVAEKIAGLQSMDEIASALGTTVSTKDGVAFSAKSYQGLDPKFIGSASVAEEGVISAPVAGSIGVYVYKVTGRDTGAFYTEDDAKNEAAQMAYYSSQMLLPTMMDDAEVEDNRARFF